MKFFTVSPRNNFLKTPGISAYHSCMFHGVAGRDGSWFPHEKSASFQDPLPSPLSIMVNRFSLAEFTWAGSSPVISAHLKERIGELPHVRFQEAVVLKAIDYEWAPGIPIPIEPGNLTNVQVFERLDACALGTTRQFFEIQGLQYRHLPADVRSGTRLSIELGTPPFAEIEEFDVSHDIFEAFPLFFLGRAMIVVDKVFVQFEEYVDRLFHVVREVC